MVSFSDAMNEYRKLLAKGAIVKAYRGLMDYFNTLRVYFAQNYPDYTVMGNVYYGYMDMTYFAITSQSLKRRKLKIAIVFLHEIFRFEVWLVGNNRAVQSEYWKLFTTSKWTKYHIAMPGPGVDAILDHIIVDAPNFRDLDALTKQIDRGTLDFIENVENFLSSK